MPSAVQIAGSPAAPRHRTASRPRSANRPYPQAPIVRERPPAPASRLPAGRCPFRQPLRHLPESGARRCTRQWPKYPARIRPRSAASPSAQRSRRLRLRRASSTPYRTSRPTPTDPPHSPDPRRSTRTGSARPRRTPGRAAANACQQAPASGRTPGAGRGTSAAGRPTRSRGTRSGAASRKAIKRKAPNQQMKNGAASGCGRPSPVRLRTTSK